MKIAESEAFSTKKDACSWQKRNSRNFPDRDDCGAVRTKAMKQACKYDIFENRHRLWRPFLLKARYNCKPCRYWFCTDKEITRKGFLSVKDISDKYGVLVRSQKVVVELVKEWVMVSPALWRYEFTQYRGRDKSCWSPRVQEEAGRWFKGLTDCSSKVRNNCNVRIQEKAVASSTLHVLEY